MSSTVLYSESIGQIELFSKLICIALYLTITIALLPALPYSYVAYYILDCEAKSFYLFDPIWLVKSIDGRQWKIVKSLYLSLPHHRLPFDWHTPFGYLVAFFCQYIGSACIMTGYIQFFSLLFGSFWLFIVIADDMTNELATLNNIVKTTNGNRMELMKRFCHIIQTYADAQE